MGKPSLHYCVPVLFRVSRRAGRNNILLNVVQWVVQLTTTNAIFKTQKRV